MTAPLAAALHAAAAGILPGEAATALLTDCGAFPSRDDFTSQFIQTAASITDGASLAWTDWHAAITAPDRGQLPASSGERSVLRLAASLAGNCPVNLRDTIPSPDHRNLNLVTTAIRRAAGRP